MKLKILIKKIKEFFKKHQHYVILSIFVIIFLTIMILFFRNIEAFGFKGKYMKMERPFLNIYDNKGNLTPYVFITHPFSREDCMKNYKKGLKAGMKFIGISSYCDYPAIISNPYDAMHDPKHLAWTYNYFDICLGWAHCFKEPAKYGIPAPETGYPQILMSESDFAKYNNHKPDTSVPKDYDFIYVCLKDNDKCEPGWQSYNRNWEEAEKMIDIMCNKYHLKGLLVGRIGCKVPSKYAEATDFMEYSKFIKQYNRCRFVFVPNTTDASPRVMTEAICYNLPVLCNNNILGGWKYVSPEVGELFNVKEDDFEEVLQKFLSKFNTYTPRDYYLREYNEEKQGKRLLEFVEECTGDKIEEIEYLVPGI